MSKRFILSTALLAAIGFGFLTEVARAEQAQAFLVFATNDGTTTASDLRDFEPSLRKVFSLKSFQLVAKAGADLKGDAAVELKLDRGMVMTVKPLGMENNTRILEVTVKQGLTTLVTSKMRMAGGAPLFIRTHERSDGLLIIVLVVR